MYCILHYTILGYMNVCIVYYYPLSAVGNFCVLNQLMFRSDTEFVIKCYAAVKYHNRLTNHVVCL